MQQINNQMGRQLMIWDRIEVTFYLLFFSLLFGRCGWTMDLSLHSIFLTAYITNLSVFELPVLNCGNISTPINSKWHKKKIWKSANGLTKSKIFCDWPKTLLCFEPWKPFSLHNHQMLLLHQSLPVHIIAQLEWYLCPHSCVHSYLSNQEFVFWMAQILQS